MTKQELKYIHNRIKNAIDSLYAANREQLRNETYAMCIIEDIEGAIEQCFEAMEKELPETISDIVNRAREKMVRELAKKEKDDYYQAVNERRKSGRHHD